MQKNYYRLVVLVILLSNGISYSQNISNKGKEFWLGFMRNLSGLQQELTLHISSDKYTTGIVDVPKYGWNTAFTVIPGIVTQVALPLDMEVGSCEIIEPLGIYVTSDNDISLSALNYRNASTDAALIFPVEALGYEYHVLSYEDAGTGSEFLIVATADNTQIEITPSENTSTLFPSGLPFYITLDAGEVYQVCVSNSGEDLTGSTVKVVKSGNSCNPIALFSGNKCAMVKCYSCDHLYEQIPPNSTWGREFITSPLQTRTSDTYRVLASTNGTTITIGNIGTVTLNAGQYWEFELSQVGSYISSNNPVLLAQYSQGHDCDNIKNSDPFMTILSPLEQSITYTNFSHIDKSTILSGFYVNIIAKTSNINNIKLDGLPITGLISTISSNVNYSYAQITTTAGDHILQCDSSFQAYLYSFGNVTSLGYSAGTNLNTIDITYYVKSNSDADIYYDFKDTICVGDSLELIPGFDSANVYWHWSMGDGTIDSNYTLYHTYTTGGNYNISLIIGDTASNSCSSSELDTLSTSVYVNSLAATSTVNDIYCNSNSGTIQINPLGDKGAYHYYWSNNPTMDTSYQNNLAAGEYIYSLTDGNCIFIDTVEVVSYPSMVTAAFTYQDSSSAVVFYSDTSNVDSLIWYFGDGSSSTNSSLTHVYSSIGTYTVMLVVFDSLGCSDTLIQQIVVPSDQAYEYWVPNVFTPQNDGLNDGFSGIGVGFSEFKIDVYNRWGNKIYNGLNEPWDGSVYDKGIAPDGVYYYLIDVEDNFGNSHHYQGHVTLIR